MFTSHTKSPIQSMKNPQVRQFLDRKCLIPVIFSSLISLTILISVTLTHDRTSSYESKPSNSESLFPNIPIFAYLISGTSGDVSRIKRLLQAVYHPRNYYILHMDLDAQDSERLEILKYVKSVGVLRMFKNVMVMGNPDMVTDNGPTMIACTLHAVGILLEQVKNWDWFINLSASDYPLMSQDDILHIFSYLPRDLNFIKHTSNIGLKEYQKVWPIIVDPGLYHSTKSQVLWTKEKRAMPSSFKLFMGSASVILTKPFLEFCIWGWDNLPRTLLMYYTNVLSSQEGYFHTVICNHPDYQNTTVNHDLRYAVPDNPEVQDFDDMVLSGLPFVHHFSKDDNHILNKIDEFLLMRLEGQFTHGGWCTGKDSCVDYYGSPVAVKPTVNSKRLEKVLAKLLDSPNFKPNQCK